MEGLLREGGGVGRDPRRLRLWVVMLGLCATMLACVTVGSVLAYAAAKASLNAEQKEAKGGEPQKPNYQPRVRQYFVAAVEVLWDYAPANWDPVMEEFFPGYTPVEWPLFPGKDGSSGQATIPPIPPPAPTAAEGHHGHRKRNVQHGPDPPLNELQSICAGLSSGDPVSQFHSSLFFIFHSSDFLFFHFFVVFCSCFFFLFLLFLSLLLFSNSWCNAILLAQTFCFDASPTELYTDGLIAATSKFA